MKEATGELNMTVITVVAIAAIAAIFYVFVWPSIQLNLQANTACSGGPGNTGGNDDITWSCADAASGASFACTVTDATNGRSTTKTCTNN